MDARFQGKIGRFYDESTAWWPDEPRPATGTPNVVLVVLDDVGFAQLGCFGSDLDTPVIDGLAADGLRFSSFHTTALCSPTRSCLLTGRNHHVNGMGRVIELATGFPGYDSRLPRSSGLLPEILTPEGFAAWAVGKWHLTPEEEVHLGASRARWPLGRGFERFYGFFPGETHQFAPYLASDNHFVRQPVPLTEGYHLTEDLIENASGFVRDLRSVDPDKPFFLYLATGACHSPHQSPPGWIERYRGRFDRGWDVWREETLTRQKALGVLPAHTELSPRPDWVPAWDDLSADERALYARYMEAFAAFLSHTDAQVGAFLDVLRDTGDFDNTIVIVLSDNGASSEGGPQGSVNDGRSWNVAPRPLKEAIARIDEIGGPRLHNNYPWGWTVAGNTPFRRWKREVHEGGVADPLVVHWPAGIRDKGAVRRQYVHAVDIAPTLLDLLDVRAPASIKGVDQRAFDGVSFAAALTDADAPSRRTRQYFEMFGCRAIYDDGWKAVTYHPIQMPEPMTDDAWELYDVVADPSECHDLAAEHPDKLREMIALWWAEAERNQVLPLDNRPFSDLVLGRPTGLPHRSTYTYWPGRPLVPEHAAVNVRNRSHRIHVDLVVPPGGAQGVLLSMGSLLGGWVLYVREDGAPAYAHSWCGYKEHRVDADRPLTPGSHTLTFRFTKTGEHEGTGELVVDGAVVGSAPIAPFTPMRFSLTGGGLTCGYGDELPVTDDLSGPSPFTGTVLRVVVTVDGEPHVDPESEAEIALTTQ
ncbi:MAG TPA: arylsulfatase [Mycobacteriales bacterium]|nr:arylsulfatase [Mycobacteriales bacterium]